MCLGKKPHRRVACNRLTEFCSNIWMAMEAREAMQRLNVVKLDKIGRIGLRCREQPDAQCLRSRPSKFKPVSWDVVGVDAYNLAIYDLVQMFQEGHLVHRWNRLPKDVSPRNLQ